MRRLNTTPLLQHSHRAPSSAAPFLLPSIDLPKIPKFERKSTGHLSEKLLGDVLVAFGVTLGVAPFISVVDKAIVQRANGSHSIISSAVASVQSMARNPIAYVKSPMFLMMWGVYGVTYSTANSLKTIVEHQEHDRKTRESRQGISQDSSSSSNAGKMAVFTGTTIVNSAVSLLKDKAYAKMFGTSGAASTVPMVTYGLWMTRDLMVVGSSFILPEVVGKKLQDEYNLNKDDALQISQLTVPIATQLFAAPVQLLGLDFYNRPLSSMGYAEAAVERTRFLANGFWSVVGARVARIFPAYSIGGVFNTKLRDQWRDHLIQKEIQQMEQTQDSFIQAGNGEPSRWSRNGENVITVLKHNQNRFYT